MVQEATLKTKNSVGKSALRFLLRASHLLINREKDPLWNFLKSMLNFSEEKCMDKFFNQFHQ